MLTKSPLYGHCTHRQLQANRVSDWFVNCVNLPHTGKCHGLPLPGQTWFYLSLRESILCTLSSLTFRGHPFMFKWIIGPHWGDCRKPRCFLVAFEGSAASWGLKFTPFSSDCSWLFFWSALAISTRLQLCHAPNTGISRRAADPQGWHSGQEQLSEGLPQLCPRQIIITFPGLYKQPQFELTI